MGGIVVIRGKITTSVYGEPGDDYPDVESELHMELPFGTTPKAEGKAVKLARQELTKFYEQLQVKLMTIDYHEE